MRTFISFLEAREIIMQTASRLPGERVSLEEALGRTLAEGISSTEDIPPFDNSAMDGYAVRREDCLEAPCSLNVIGDIPAGFLFDREVVSGTCARIMTGAPVPRGADAIVPVEKTRPEGNTVCIEKCPAEHAHIRWAGEDVKSGEQILHAGSVITPPTIGMLATLGAVPVPVTERPRVSVISTGDEIIPPDKTPGPGQIRNSNGPALAAQVCSAGGVVQSLMHAPDDPDQLREIVERAQEAHIILFAGGVSMGEYDCVQTTLVEMGAVWKFWKVKQRPGKPLIFGTLGAALLFGLPGNPVSSAMCFEIYVRPLLARMLQRDNEIRPLTQARLGRKMTKANDLHHFARGIVETDESTGELRVVDTGPQGSNLYSSVLNANCIIHLPPEMQNPEAEARVMIERLVW